jgi:hypothetical protein
LSDADWVVVVTAIQVDKVYPPPSSYEPPPTNESVLPCESNPEIEVGVTPRYSKAATNTSEDVVEDPKVAFRTYEDTLEKVEVLVAVWTGLLASTIGVDGATTTKADTKAAKRSISIGMNESLSLLDEFSFINPILTSSLFLCSFYKAELGF